MLSSDDMTSRFCHIVRQTAISAAIVLLPLAAVVVLVMIKTPVDIKYILGGSSTLVISLGSWILGRKHATKYRPRQRSPGESRQVNEPGLSEDIDQG
jgi:hypothetical protein